MNSCKKCGNKLALCSTSITWGEWDDFPYKNEVEEHVLYKDGSESEEPSLEIYLALLICPDCNYCEWMSIEEGNYEIHDIYNHTLTEHYGWFNARCSDLIKSENPLPANGDYTGGR